MPGKDESQNDSKTECLDRYYPPDMDTARVVRDNGRVIVKFGEEYEDILKDIYGESYPYIFLIFTTMSFIMSFVETRAMYVDVNDQPKWTD